MLPHVNEDAVFLIGEFSCLQFSPNRICVIMNVNLLFVDSELYRDIDDGTVFYF